jgi:hypothetical protein
MSTAEHALDLARAELGYQEGWSAGHWNNRNKFGASFGADGQPWCAFFVNWVLSHAGVPIGSIPTSGSCTANMNWARTHDRWHAGTKGIRPGDVVIFNGHPGGTPVHTGILEASTATSVTTIDGNTNSSGAAEGNAVLRKTRPANRVIGFIRPDYTAQEVAMVPTVKAVADGKDVVLELPARMIPRGEWVSVARFGMLNAKRSYRLSTQVCLDLAQTTGERPAYIKVRWAREGWGAAKAGELDTTSTTTFAVPDKLKTACPVKAHTEKDGGGIMATQVYVEGAGSFFVSEIVADCK